MAGWKKWASVVVVAGLSCLVLWWFSNSEPALVPIERSFQGSSQLLGQTMIVPTLDTPQAAGKSVIWCSAFQIAWNQLKTDLAKGPVLLANAQEITHRLNRAEPSAADLSSEEYYAAAGLMKDGILERIRQEMATKFPAGPAVELDDASAAAIAYAYLNANVKYNLPFFDNPEPFLFKGAGGEEVSVRSFGIRLRDAHGVTKIREQVEILFNTYTDLNQAELGEFALDLSKDSAPNQIVLARIEKQGSLAAALARLAKMRTETPAKNFERRVREIETVLVPNMAWRIEHRFKELEGPDKAFLNPSLQGLYLAVAHQSIQFQMDRVGVRVESAAMTNAKSIPPRHFHFDRPFLLHLTKRGAEHPFFVMWVDNAELLQARD